jgi:hypothetical protein
LKIANDILKRHPNHGETLSMKAMILSYTNADKEQYFSLAKQVNYCKKDIVIIFKK